VSRVWGDVTVIVERWDGTRHRWAGDELDAANIPCDLVYSTSMPGGFKSCTCTLFRDLGEPTPEGLFDTVRILGPGGVTYWEGRLQAMPSSTDDGGRITPSAVGWAAHLEDRQDIQQIWVDRDLGQWGPVTDQRRSTERPSWRIIDGESAWDSESAGPVLRLWHGPGEPAWNTAPARPHISIRYDGGGAAIAGLEARVVRAVGLTGWTFATHGWDRAQTTFNNVTSLSTTIGGRVAASFDPSSSRAAEFALYYAGAPGGGADGDWGAALTDVAVYGDLSGVRTARTDSPRYGAGQGPYGVPADSVIRTAITRWAPKLRVDDESVQRTTYLIPHLAQREPGTLTSLIELCNRFHWWDWGVWEDRRFWFHARFGGRSKTWLVSTEDGAALTDEGETTDVVWTGGMVSYTDFGGASHTVGCPGSPAERVDRRLATNDIGNPAALHGIPRIAHFAYSERADYEGAVFGGMAWLEAQAQASRRGTCTVSGTVLDEHGNEHPADLIRAGDKLIVSNRPDDPPRRVIETSMVHATRTNSLTLDNTAETYDALLERMGASFVGVL
jgi:hypothetical protein